MRNVYFEDKTKYWDYRSNLVDAPDKDLLILRDAITAELQRRNLTI
jgi:hypothetical protein